MLGLTSLSMTDNVQPVKVIDGRKLRRRRVAAGLTQAMLGERAGCSDVHIWYLENNRRDASPPMLAAIAAGLECQTTDLMPDEPNGNAA